MSFWSALAVDAEKAVSLWLALALVVGVALIRASGRAAMQAERHRVRIATMLVALHLILMGMTVILRHSTDRVWRDFQLVAYVLGVVAATGIAGMIVFGAILPRLRIVTPIILRDVITGGATVIAVIAVAARSGFDISGVVATSAVITAVIGFSLQDMLANVAGGLTLQLDESIQVGDWIKVGDIVGRVVEIRWRYTAVETRNWETVYLANTQLTKGQVISLGKRRGQPQQLRRWVWFTVDYRYSPTDVMTVVTRGVIDSALANVARDPPPNCVLMDITDSYAKYALRYWLTDLVQDDPTDSAVRTRLYYALRRANIPLAMPAVAAFVTSETTERKSLKRAEDHDRRMKALKHIGLFNRLPEDVLEHLAEGLVPAPFAPGEVLTHQGAEAHWLYMIVQGEVSLRRASNGGSEREIRKLGAGSFVGEMSLLTGEPREATIVALTDVDCYRLDRALACDVLTRRPEFAEYIAEVMARRHVQDENADAPLDRETEDRRVHAAKEDLLTRIRDFFELADPDEPKARGG